MDMTRISRKRCAPRSTISESQGCDLQDSESGKGCFKRAYHLLDSVFGCEDVLGPIRDCAPDSGFDSDSSQSAVYALGTLYRILSDIFR